jgi:hypothetical protein
VGWNVCYYNALAHVLYEPQRYGLQHFVDRMKRKSARDTLRNVRDNHEKPLNDIFEVFLRLLLRNLQRASLAQGPTRVQIARRSGA